MKRKDINNPDNRENALVLEKIGYLRNVKGLPRLACKTLRAYLRKLPPRRRTPSLYLVLANLYIDTGQTDKAIAAFKVATRKANIQGDELTCADVLRKWGYLYLHMDKGFQRACPKLKEAVSIVDRIMAKDRRSEVKKVAANCYASMGNYHFESGHLTEATRAYVKALAFARASNFKERTVTVLGDLANIALRKKEWARAEKLLRESEKRARRYYKHALPSSLLRLGFLFSNPENPKMDLKRASILFKESLQIARRGGWKREEADALLAFGSLHKETKEAERQIQMARKIYRDLQYRHL